MSKLFRSSVVAVQFAIAVMLPAVQVAASENPVCVTLIRQGDMEKARAVCEARAREGDAESQFWRGLVEFDTNWEAADEWLKKSAAQGFAPALHELGVRHQRRAKGRQEVQKQAIEYLRQAAMLDYLPAQLALGVAYRVGQGVSPDPTTAEKWLKLAAQGGSAEAMRLLAEQQLLHRHEGTEQLMFKAALHGDPYAQFSTAGEYLRGDERPKDIIEGYAWLLLAAESGIQDIGRSKNTFALQIPAHEQAMAKQRAEELRKSLVPVPAGLYHPGIPHQRPKPSALEEARLAERIREEADRGDPVKVSGSSPIIKRGSKIYENVDLRGLGAESCIGFTAEGAFDLRPRSADEKAERELLNMSFPSMRCRENIDGKVARPIGRESITLRDSPRIVDSVDGDNRKIVAYDGDTVRWEYILSPREGKVVYAPEVYRLRDDEVVLLIQGQFHFINPSTGEAKITKPTPAGGTTLYALSNDGKGLFVFLEYGSRQEPDRSGVYKVEALGCGCVTPLADIDKQRYSIKELRLTSDEQYLVVTHKRMVGSGYGFSIVDVNKGEIVFNEEWPGSGKIEEVVVDAPGRFGIYAVEYSYDRGKRRDERLTHYEYAAR